MKLGGLMLMPLSMEGVMPLGQWVSEPSFSLSVYIPCFYAAPTNLLPLMQEELVVMETYTARDTGRTVQL